ncbi:primosomal protein N' [soil metagenome]
MTDRTPAEQLSLVPAPAEPSPSRGTSSGDVADVAGDDPVAEILVDTPLAHLDRPFEYSVPAPMGEQAEPGARVKVRFAGKDLDGYVLARKALAAHPGRLAPLRRVVSPEPVLTRHLAQLCRELADHYAGSMADVVRLAVPPRHARAERAVPPPVGVGQVVRASPDAAPQPPAHGTDAPGPAPWAGPSTAWQDHPAGPALLRHLASGGGPAASWTALPDAGSDDGWPTALAQAVAATGASGRGAVVVLPDHRDIERLAAALDRVLGPGRHVRLTADLGPQQRYDAWLRVLRGHVDVAIGSRSAAYAPVRALGLVAWWDDGDDSLAEPRGPYPHVREVLRRRAALTGAGLISGGHVRTPEVQQWVESGLLREVSATPAVVRARAPRVLVAGEGHQEAGDPAASLARIPTLAWRTVKDALRSGPVLVQVPRRGYLVGLSCQECRVPLRCAACSGPVVVPDTDCAPRCRWCGEVCADRPCPTCGATARRSTVVGERRTAEEIGRAFAGVSVRTSRAGRLLAAVPDRPAVVVATPGAEPLADGGYAATLLLDGWALLDRAGLDSGMEAHRRWSAAAALTRGAADGGVVVLCGVPPHARLRAVEALVRWDPPWAARSELAERRELGLPPVTRTAVLQGVPEVVREALAALQVGAFTVLGPLPVRGTGRTRQDGGSGDVQAVLSGGAADGGELVRAVRALRSGRSMRKAQGDLRVRMDPGDLTG